MNNHMTEKLIRHLRQNNVISKENEVIYAFGFRQLQGFSIGLATDIFVGILLGMVMESVLFSLMYIPLRQYTGGYHAPNSRICYVLSVMLICSALIIIRCIEISVEVLFVAIFLSLCIIFIKAPVESRNKPLNDREKSVFRKYARIIAVIESFMCIVLFFLTYKSAAECILIAINISAALLMFSDKRN